MKTQMQELVSRLKTWLWSAFWVGLVYFVDLLSQTIAGASLPDVTTNLFGLLPTAIVINTAIPIGLVVNQLSKYLHNLRSGQVE